MLRKMKSLQKFTSLHTNAYGHLNQERRLIDWET